MSTCARARSPRAAVAGDVPWSQVSSFASFFGLPSRRRNGLRRSERTGPGAPPAGAPGAVAARERPSSIRAGLRAGRSWCSAFPRIAQWPGRPGAVARGTPAPAYRCGGSTGWRGGAALPVSLFTRLARREPESNPDDTRLRPEGPAGTDAAPLKCDRREPDHGKGVRIMRSASTRRPETPPRAGTRSTKEDAYPDGRDGLEDGPEGELDSPEGRLNSRARTRGTSPAVRWSPAPTAKAAGGPMKTWRQAARTRTCGAVPAKSSKGRRNRTPEPPASHTEPRASQPPRSPQPMPAGHPKPTRSSDVCRANV